MATASYATVLNHTDVDFCVVGECDNALPALVSGFGTDKPIPSGVAWRDGFAAVNLVPGNRDDQVRLDSTALLDFGCWDPTSVGGGSVGFPQTLCYSTVRGCPHNCSFCANLLRGNVRLTGEPKLSREFDALRSTGVEFLNLNDPTFNVDESHCMLVCSLMAHYGFGWTCTIRASGLSRSLIRAMHDSGCAAAFLGIETLDQRLLDTHNKGVSTQDIEDAVDACLAEGLPLVGFFILGLPGETEESLHRSLDFVQRYPFPPRAKFATPYPGTHLAHLYRNHHQQITEEELLLQLDEVTNGPDDNTTWGLSKTPRAVLLQYMQEFRSLESERSGASQSGGHVGGSTASRSTGTRLAKGHLGRGLR